MPTYKVRHSGAWEQFWPDALNAVTQNVNLDTLPLHQQVSMRSVKIT